jgi:D-glycero-alpha-D-manno-heptose-7-phosphate kinase
MKEQIRKKLESRPIEASAPCRIDMGGTLDISTFSYPLRHLAPCTFNIALNLRTRVRLLPFTRNKIKISSRGFRDAIFAADAAPFDHALGLMFATAAYFNASGIHIDIESQSPPRSALGGSSVAAVALYAALSKLLATEPSTHRQDRRLTALAVHQIEQSAAGVPCGIQDQLAAAYGGVNIWHWLADAEQRIYRRQCAVRKNRHPTLERRILVAYCGKPHVSKDVNGMWVRQFLSGGYRDLWAEIIDCTRKFAAAMVNGDYQQAAVQMNRETSLRRTLTPDVLDHTGEKLVHAASQNACGARFTGAGGGGCLWSVGEIENIDRLRPLWEKTLASTESARLLKVKIDSKGLEVE